MKQSDLKKYMLIKSNEADEVIFRVIDIAEKVLVIDCNKKTMPVWRTFENLKDYVDVKTEELELSFLEALEHLAPDDRKIAYQRFNMISGIIPFLADERMRAEVINHIAEEYQVSSKTIRKYLCDYLASMNISSLVPKKRNENRELTKDEKNIRKSLNKWYYTSKKRTLKSCYTLMLKNYYCDVEGKLLPDYPSFYQYRYFFRKYNKKETEYISRNGISYYGRNQRPLIGDGVQSSFASTVGVCMLDSTVCDIYICNEAGEVIGRPILTIGVDTYSGMVCGYSLSWEGGIYSLRDLMLNVITDKVMHCSAIGIHISSEQWPCKKMPMKLVTDQGSEYKGFNFEQITDLGVEVINLKSYHAEQKGSVEKCFDVIQNYYKSVLKGYGVVEEDFQERGAVDYRKQACLTLTDFEKVIVNCIVFYNSSRLLENFPFTEEMLEAEVKPIPCYVWKWAEGQYGANLMDVSKEEMIKVLLPRTIGKFSRFGLSVNGMHYHNNLFKESYLQGKECTVAYDMDSANHIYLIENGDYIEFELIESRFMNKDIETVKEMKSRHRKLVKKEVSQKTQAEIDLVRAIQTIVDGTNSSLKPSIKNIRDNRKKERIKEHKQHLKEVLNNV